MEGLVSLQLGEHSVQFDEESGELLIAGNESQCLLSAAETMALCEFLYQQRDAVFAASHKSVAKPHPEYCLCDECAAFRFAMCGYED